MALHSNTNRQEVMKLPQVIVALLLLFSPPVLSTAATFLTMPTFGVKSKIHKKIMLILLLLFSTSLFAFLAAFFNANNSDEAIRSLKFIFMGFCLVSGASLKADLRSIKKIARILCLLLLLWYTISVNLSVVFPSLIYPPDNNGAAITIFFLSFILADRENILYRIVLMCFLFIFASIVDSRLLLILLPVFLLSQPVSISLFRLFLFIGLCIIVYIWSVNANLWGNWSDLVRLELYNTTFEYFKTNGVYLISSGTSNFINNLNAALPKIISAHFELAHAHNALTQILGSYGLLAFLSFSGVLLVLINISINLSDETLRNQMIFICAVFMIETVISDSRIAYIIFLFIGLQLGATLKNNKIAEKR